MSLEEYADIDLDRDKIDRLYKLVVHAPNTNRNLKGLSISKQLEVFDRILSKFPNDPFVAISIMEHYDLNEHDMNDEMELLLMELAIRRIITEDHKDKVYHILGIVTGKQIGRAHV